MTGLWKPPEDCEIMEGRLKLKNLQNSLVSGRWKFSQCDNVTPIKYFHRCFFKKRRLWNVWFWSFLFILPGFTHLSVFSRSKDQVDFFWNQKFDLIVESRLRWGIWGVREPKCAKTVDKTGDSPIDACNLFELPLTQPFLYADLGFDEFISSATILETEVGAETGFSVKVEFKHPKKENNFPRNRRINFHRSHEKKIKRRNYRQLGNAMCCRTVKNFFYF